MNFIIPLASDTQVNGSFDKISPMRVIKAISTFTPSCPQTSKTGMPLSSANALAV